MTDIYYYKLKGAVANVIINENFHQKSQAKKRAEQLAHAANLLINTAMRIPDFDRFEMLYDEDNDGDGHFYLRIRDRHECSENSFKFVLEIFPIFFEDTPETSDRAGGEI